VSENSAAQTGNIYDLGYRSYEGERLGRSYAIVSLYLYSLRAVFGLGRSAWAKVFPFGLAAIAMIPSSVQLAIAAIAPADLDLIKPENYFEFVQVVVALFCAVSAPEIIGRDQRHQTLPLYFSRSLSRADYVSAKLAALATALFAVLALPQVLLLLGNGVADDDLLGYFRDNLDQVPAVLAGSLLAAALMSSVSLAIASLTPRRAISTVAVIAYFVVLTTIGGVLVRTTDGSVRQFSVLVSPFDVLNGSIRWLFDAEADVDSDIGRAGLAGGYYLLGAAAYTLASAAILYRRFLRLAV